MIYQIYILLKLKIVLKHVKQKFLANKLRLSTYFE